MDGSSASLAKLLANDPQSRTALWWGLAAASAVAAGTTFWWLTRDRLDDVYRGYVPIQASAAPSSSRAPAWLGGRPPGAAAAAAALGGQPSVREVRVCQLLLYGM
jgi:hypothetical protein